MSEWPSKVLYEPRGSKAPFCCDYWDEIRGVYRSYSSKDTNISAVFYNSRRNTCLLHLQIFILKNE